MSASYQISLGIGSPASIGKFITFGLGAAPLTTVPDVVGETQAQATTDITAVGLTVSVSTAYSSTVAAGLVISQSPTAGSQVSPGSNVEIIVSLGDRPVESGGGGGFFFAYEQERARRRRKQREEEERDEAARELQDKVDREIAELLRIQEAKDEERDNLARLQRLVRQHSREELMLSDRAKVAYMRALTQANFSAMQALDRELQRMLEEEEIAALMLLLNDE